MHHAVVGTEEVPAILRIRYICRIACDPESEFLREPEKMPIDVLLIVLLCRFGDCLCLCIPAAAEIDRRKN